MPSQEVALLARSATFAFAALLTCACSAAPPSPESTRSQPLTAPPTTPTQLVASPSPTATAAALPLPSPTPTTLHAGGFARIVVAELNVRTGPSTGAPQLVQHVVQDGGSGDNIIRLGKRYKLTRVYLMDGPVVADGLRWWRVNPTVESDGEIESTSAWPSFITGWIAEGGGSDTWVVPDDPCPPRPVEVASLTLPKANWAIGVGCFGGEQLTLHGWYAGPPPGPADDECDLAPAFLCKPASIFPVQHGWGPGNENRFDFYFDPARGANPASGQWLDVTGMFNGPLASPCPVDSNIGDLACGYPFVASDFRIAAD